MPGFVPGIPDLVQLVGAVRLEVGRVDWSVTSQTGQKRGVQTFGPVDRARACGRAGPAEKYREDRVRELGYEVVRVTWSELADLPALRRRIEAAVPRARRRGVPVEVRARS